MKDRAQLRIIAGEDRGRKLKSPPNNTIRPTSGMAREAIFNILGDLVPDSDFLDLYAGSGAVGLEALSRGARSVTLVEHDRLGIELLRKNVSVMTRSASCRLWSGNVVSQCRRMARARKTFDIIFVDPPYDEQGITIRSIEPLLTRQGTIIYQRPAKKAVGDPFEKTRLTCYDVRRYGKTELSFWTFPENLVET